MTKKFILTYTILLFFFANNLCATAVLLSFPLSADERGTVTCIENPSISYDIYLPPAYSINSTPLPILYTFNAGGGGMVAKFKAACSTLNIIVVGVTGPKNNLGWDIVLKECYAVTRDIRSRVLFDPTAEFAGGFSGGGLVSYMFSRIRAQHVAGIFPMGGWLGRIDGYPPYHPYQTTDRVLANLLVARSMGSSDGGSWVMTPDANYLSQWSAAINDWYFDGGHQVPPDSVKTSALSWLISQRTPAAPNDRSNATVQTQTWRSAIATGQTETVMRECVTILMNNPRSWYAYEAQLVMDELMADYVTFSSLSFSNLAQGDFAADLFYYYAYGAALNSDQSRYHSCLKALTGIGGTNGDRAGDIYNLLQRFGHPDPRFQCSVDQNLDQVNLWVLKDTPGLTYTHQTRTNLLSGVWKSEEASIVESNTLWSAFFDMTPVSKSSFYRVETTKVPAISPPWPPQ